jgi:hypothetical protein
MLKLKPHSGFHDLFLKSIADKRDWFVIIMKQKSPFLVFLILQWNFRQSDSFNFSV